jgi:aryl carrier-like protein
VEEALARIWEELLQVEEVGRNDNFFELGGHSLLAVQLLARIQTELKLDVTLRMLFEAPTIKALSRDLEQESRSSA